MSVESNDIVNSYQNAKNQVHTNIKAFTKNLNSSRINYLQEKNNVTLCVGAGISADINKALHKCTYLWNGLVYAIAGELLKGETIIPTCSINNKYQDDIYKAIDDLVKEQKFLETDNTLECVEYLKGWAFACEQGTKEEIYAENVLALITHELFNSKRLGGADPVEEELAKEHNESHNEKNEYIMEHGHTIIEIAHLIDRMHNTHQSEDIEIISYNYDDYLETAIKYLHPSLQIDPIYDDISQQKAVSGHVHIYHVHGYVPKTWNETSLNGEFVFSESSYGHMSDEVYHWTNRTQAMAFIQKPVLFIGFSGVDINFRRLMKEIKKENDRIGSFIDTTNSHKLFMGYKTVVDKICNDDFWKNLMGESSTKIKENDAVVIAEKMVKAIIHAKDSYYKNQLGIELLWYGEISEIPDMLNGFCN